MQVSLFSSAQLTGYTVAIKMSGSELRGQEEAACMRIFRPTRPLQ